MSQPRNDRGASPRGERTTRLLAVLALAMAFVSLVLAGWALRTQQRSEERIRAVSEELRRALTPHVLPMTPPPLALDPDDT